MKNGIVSLFGQINFQKLSSRNSFKRNLVNCVFPSDADEKPGFKKVVFKADRLFPLWDWRKRNLSAPSSLTASVISLVPFQTKLNIQNIIWHYHISEKSQRTARTMHTYTHKCRPTFTYKCIHIHINVNTFG